MRCYAVYYKILCFAIILVWQASRVKAQTNLVPNSSFEDYITCPTALNQLSNARNWFSPLNTDSSSPDYLNGCSKKASVPSNIYGYQTAHTGNAYAGIYLLNYPAGNAHNPYREYIGCKLSEPLVCGRLYQLTYYVSAAQEGIHTSAIQALFSRSYIYKNSRNMIEFKPQLYNSYYNMIKDTGVWTEVQANYAATGNEQYLYIGNFNLDSTSNTVLSDSSQFTHAYVYIDDVSLHAINNDWCDTIQNTQPVILPLAFTPNNDQLNDTWHLLGLTRFSAIDLKVYDRWGNIVFSTNDPHFHWDGTIGGRALPQATYIWILNYQIEGKRGIYFEKGEVNIIH